MDTLKTLLACWLAVFVSTASAYSRDDPRYHKVVYRYKPIPVHSISIDTNAGRVDGTESLPDNCAAFKLTEKHVREFLRKARSVSHKYYENEVAWVPCYAEGRVVFKNGAEANWSIHPSQGGSIDFTKGKDRNKGTFLFCPSCDLDFEGYYPPITTTTK
jgi:hypothetical protein